MLRKFWDWFFRRPSKEEIDQRVRERYDNYKKWAREDQENVSRRAKDNKKNS